MEMGSARPTFLVPPDDFKLWDKETELEYEGWKGRAGNSKSISKEDFRQCYIDLNIQYNLEEVFGNLESGFGAFEKLLTFINIFPSYSLVEELKNRYVDKSNIIVKHFIEEGVKSVRELQIAELSQFGSEGVKENHNSEEENVENVENHEARESDATVEKVLEKLSSSVDISNLEENDVNAQVSEAQNQSAGRRKKKIKKKRMERLLKFHQKLVDQSGLPPSRLMELQTPKLSPTGGRKRRKILDEFHLPGESLKEQQIETKPRAPEPGAPAVGTGSSAASSGAFQTLGQGTGITSGITNFSTLSSGFPTGGWGNVGLSLAGQSPGGSDARPWVQQCGNGWNNMQQPSQDMFIGVTSGYTNHLSLCSSPQSWVSLIAPRPAYCGGCMQFGTVYTTTA